MGIVVSTRASPRLYVSWYKTVLQTDGCNLSKDAQGELWLSWCPHRGQSSETGFFAFLFLAITQEECEPVEDGDSHTMACIPQTLEWFCRWLWHYWRYGPLWPLRRKGNVPFPNLQRVCMVAKKLKKILVLAEVLKTSLRSQQLVLPVREIYC